jgi:hypothetical protein
MQSRVTNHKFRVPKNFAAGTLFALILFCLPTANVSAQEEPREQPKPQERVSKPGEIQTGQKKVRVVNRAEMRPDRKPVSTPVNGKTVRMEEALKAPSRVVQGKRQTDVDMAQAENPKVGSGEQRPRMEAEPKPAGSHLELVLKVTSGGAAEVVSAKELPGPAATSQTGPGQWVYAVFSGEKAIKAQAIPDPFEMRSFAPPPGSPLEGQGHHIEHTQTALVPIAVPNITLKSPELSRLSVQLYRVKEGPPLLQIDPSVFQKLQQEQRLEMKIRIPAATLRHQINLREQTGKTPQ